MLKLSLFRYPLGHSFSPNVHKSFAKEFGLDCSYEQIEALPATFLDKIELFRQSGGSGANVTRPLKECAFTLCKKVSDRSLEAKSVNTLYWQDGMLCGDSTDGVGLVRDIVQNLKLSLQNKTVAIFGAGGAAASIIFQILLQRPHKIILCNRGLQRAYDICARFNTARIEVCGFDEVGGGLDWIINTTPKDASISFNFEIMKDCYVYELDYSKDRSKSDFAKRAERYGASAVFDGIGMLIEQARESFSIWTGLTPIGDYGLSCK